jgi:hypothetical protein
MTDKLLAGYVVGGQAEYDKGGTLAKPVGG